MRPLRVQIYKDRKKEWRWRMLAPNGRIVADSAESYTRRATCYSQARRIVYSCYRRGVNWEDIR